MTQRIGSYEVFEIIGDGGMATVYRGRDPRFDRPVAVKVLDAKLIRGNPGLVDRFKTEAIIQAKLNHPHVVTVLDFVADGGVLAMIMEYVEGKPLSRIIEDQRGPMPPVRAVRLMSQALSAMEYAHQQGLVHRDIKPSNILVQSRGLDEFAKVMDFGIAKILGSEKLGTLTGTQMGTLMYMSPEHVRSPKYVDARSDIYALGVTLFEMLTGRVPFDSDSFVELARKIDSEPPPDIGHLQPGVPRGLAEAVNRALAKDPAKRFQSCREFREALEGALAAHPSPQARPQPGPVQATPISPPSSSPASALSAPSPVRGRAGADAPGGVSSDPAPVFSASHESSGPSGLAIGLGVAAVAIVVLMGGLWLSKSAEEKARLERAVAEERARAEQEGRDRQAAEERARAEASARERERAEQQRREAVAAEEARRQEEARKQAETAALRQQEEQAKREREREAAAAAQREREAQAAAQRQRLEEERRQAAAAAAAQQEREEQARRERERQSADLWVDPSTNLMWAKRDNGSNVNWHQAKQYCESLTLGGYSDWRLPGVGQLEGLYDRSGGQSGRYIKSPLTLTGWWAWSSEMPNSSSAWYFLFNAGKRGWDSLVRSYDLRALCVRGPGR